MAEILLKGSQQRVNEEQAKAIPAEILQGWEKLVKEGKALINQREKLWCYKIDKEIIYKGKVAYDISTRQGRRSLWRAEEYMRKMDERDGYPKQPWKKEIYAKKGGKLALGEKINYIRNES